MKLKNIQCPNCSSSLGDIKLENGANIQCPYCKTIFWAEDENSFTYNENVNRTQTININQTTRTINETEIHRINARMKEKEYENKENKRNIIIGACLILIFLVTLSFTVISSNAKRNRAIANGLICPGSSSEYEGMNYKAAIKKLKLLGFTNFEKIDLHEGIAMINNGDVTEISIDGYTIFSAFDGFPPDAQIIISYK